MEDGGRKTEDGRKWSVIRPPSSVFRPRCQRKGNAVKYFDCQDIFKGITQKPGAGIAERKIKRIDESFAKQFPMVAFTTHER
jgi:hypothetical protein